MLKKENIRYFSALAVILVIFVFDTFTPRGHLDWFFYIIPLIFFSLNLKRSRILQIGILSIVFVIMGFVFSPPGILTELAILNRVVGSLVLIIITWVSLKLKDDHEKIVVSLKEKESLLKEKEMLLKESHHRIKNNLQVIISLLNLQSLEITDKTMRSKFQESQNRIRAMSLIHEKLYISHNLVDIDLNNYINELINSLISNYNVNETEIKISSQIDNLKLDSKISLNLGLILNEFCSNSLKHAFKGKDEGIINISLKNENNGKVKLVYKDDGVGISEDKKIIQPSTLGMQLIDSFVNQINGEMTFNKNNGMEFLIYFPYEEKVD